MSHAERRFEGHIMTDFLRERRNMVECQIHPNGVTDYRLLDAFLEVRREVFVGPVMRPMAYIDEDLPLTIHHPKRFLMEARAFAKLVHLARVMPTDIVLDVGCGSGYSAAILSRLAASVVALEVDEGLAEQAQANLIAEGCANAAVVSGPLEAGYAKEGPYDLIVLNGAIDVLPDTFREQLKDGGRLVTVVGHGNAGTARVYFREGDIMSPRDAFNAAVMPLPGFERAEEFVF